MPSMTSSSALMSACMSSRSKGVTKVASSLCPMVWLISSPRCSTSRISPARRPISSQERSSAPPTTFAASSTKRSKKRSSRGIRRSRTGHRVQARGDARPHPCRVCHARTVDGAVIVFFVAMAILLAVAIAIATSRGRTLDEIRGLTEERFPGDEPAARVRRLLAESAAAELELDRARRDLAYLIEIIGVGIVAIGDDRRITSANAAAHTLLERPAGSLRGLTITGAFLDARIDAIVEAAHESGAGSGEVRLRPDAAMLVVRARRSPVEGLWMVLEDVSELRRLQQIRAEFIDNLSHELRTPLTTVSLLAETLT